MARRVQFNGAVLLIGEDYEVRKLPVQDPSVLTHDEIRDLVTSYLEVSFPNPDEVTALPWPTRNALELYILRLHKEDPSRTGSPILTPYSLTRPLVASGSEELLVGRVEVDGPENAWTVIHGIGRDGATFFFDVIPPEEQNRVDEVIRQIQSERGHIPIREVNLNEAWKSVEELPPDLVLNSSRLHLHLKRVAVICLTALLIAGLCWARGRYRDFTRTKASLAKLRQEDARLSSQLAAVSRTLAAVEQIPPELTKEWNPYNELRRLSRLYDPNSFWVKSLTMSREKGIEAITFVIYGKTPERIRKTARRLMEEFRGYIYTYRRPTARHGFIVMEITLSKGGANEGSAWHSSAVETQGTSSPNMVDAARVGTGWRDGLALRQAVPQVSRAFPADQAACRKEESPAGADAAASEEPFNPITALLSWFPPAPALAAEGAVKGHPRSEAARSEAAKAQRLQGQTHGPWQPTAARRSPEAPSSLPGGHPDHRTAGRGLQFDVHGPDPKRLRHLFDHTIRDFMAIPPAFLMRQTRTVKRQTVPEFSELDAVAARLSRETEKPDEPAISVIAVWGSGCLARVNGRSLFLRVGEPTEDGLTLVATDPLRGTAYIEHAGWKHKLSVFSSLPRWNSALAEHRW